MQGFLDALGMGEYCEILQGEGFDSLAKLSVVEEADLVAIGMKRGTQRWLL